MQPLGYSDLCLPTWCHHVFNHPIIRFTAIKTCCITRQQQSCPTSGFASGCWHCDHWQSATLQCHLWSCEKKTTKTRRGCYETFQRVNLKQEIWVRAEVSIRDSLARIRTKRIMTWSRILKCPGNQNYIIIYMRGKQPYFSTRFLLFQKQSWRSGTETGSELWTNTTKTYTPGKKFDMEPENDDLQSPPLLCMTTCLMSWISENDAKSSFFGLFTLKSSWLLQQWCSWCFGIQTGFQITSKPPKH